MPEFEESEGFKLRSGNKSSFKQLGSSPAKDLGHGGHAGLSQEEASKRTHGGKMSIKDKKLRAKRSVETEQGITKVKDVIKKAVGIEKKGTRVAKGLTKGLRTVTERLLKEKKATNWLDFPDFLREEKLEIVKKKKKKKVKDTTKKKTCPAGYHLVGGVCVLTKEGKDYLEHVKKEKEKKEKVVKIPVKEVKLDESKPPKTLPKVKVKDTVKEKYKKQSKDIEEELKETIG